MDKIVDAKELATILGITPRRVRQLAEEDVLLRIERGRYHISQAIESSIANKILGTDEKRQAGPMTLAAVGWLQGFAIVNELVTARDRKLWKNLCVECNHKASEATLANAASLMGKKAPRFT